MPSEGPSSASRHPGYRTLTPDLDLWLSQPDDDLARALRSPNRPFNMFGRLRPGVTLEQAQADLRSLESPLGAELPMHRGLGTHDRFAAGGVCRLPAAAGAGAAGCGVSAPAHRVRQRRRTAAGAGGRSPEGDGVRAALGSSRNANPAAAADRERAAVVRRRCARHRRSRGWGCAPSSTPACRPIAISRT